MSDEKKPSMAHELRDALQQAQLAALKAAQNAAPGTGAEVLAFAEAARLLGEVNLRQ